MNTDERFLLGTEIHSTEELNAAFAEGLDPNEPIDGTLPLDWLMEMYMRSPRFPACVQAVIDAGAHCDDPVLLSVLLDDAEAIRRHVDADPICLQRRLDLKCTFTPLMGVSLLHVAAEYGLVNAARALLDLGVDPNCLAAEDAHGFNGHTPIFHTVNSLFNIGEPVLRLLLDREARADIQLKGITWGVGFDWETILFDTTLLSYTQAGLIPQFQRDEIDIYENIKLICGHLRRNVPPLANVPNKYWAQKSRA